jgi:soluble lytic murein transglycosylase-like protein
LRTDGTSQNNCAEGFHVSDGIIVTLTHWSPGFTIDSAGNPICSISQQDPTLVCLGDIEFSGDLGRAGTDPAYTFAFGPGGAFQHGLCQPPPAFFDSFFPFFRTRYDQPGVHTIQATVFACRRTVPGQNVFAPSNVILATTTLTINVLPDKAKAKFRLRVLDFQTDSDLSSFDFTDSTTAPQQPLKLGQEVRLFVFPVLPDGTEDHLLSVTESITDAKDMSPGDSEIFAIKKELFPQRVVLHFPVSNVSQFHHLFPIHSGSANVHLAFQAQGKNFEITLPIKVTNCTAGDCAGALGASHPEFDDLLMKFADRNGVPPQLLKAQIQNESNFNPRAFRYEPVSVDFGQIAAMSFRLLSNKPFRPWALAQSSDCSNAHIFFPQGAQLDLTTEDGNARSQYALSRDGKGDPLCRMTNANQVTNPKPIIPQDTLTAMENIFYTNDNNQGVNNWEAVSIRASKGRNSSVQRFYDYQVDNAQFTAQTVLASSYGLHQILYTTAVSMRYVDKNGIGLSPGNLFRPSISLDLGTQYIATQFRNTDGAENLDYANTNDLLSQFAPALRAFNAGSSDFTVAEFKAGCTTTPKVKFAYACPIFNNSVKFVPAPLTGGGTNENDVFCSPNSLYCY